MSINYLNKPTTSVSHGLAIFVTVPRQEEHTLVQLKNLERNIGLVLYREGEDVVSQPISIPYQTTEGKLENQSPIKTSQYPMFWPIAIFHIPP